MSRTVFSSLALLAALALLAPSPSPAVEAAPGPAVDPASLAIPYERFVLSNGLTVLVHTDPSVPIVAVNLWYHVGSRNERRGRTGFAHLFEHFFFNGSENYPHGFREAMDDLGANNRNGTTNGDRTNFFEDVPTSALERTLYLEADRMGFLAGHLSQEMLERERGVVKNEKRQGENQPYGRVFDHVGEVIYPYSHPYSWSTIGSLEDLDAATLDDVKEWYRTYYGPNNAVLSLAGDVTVERARELVEWYFGAIPPGPPLARLDAWVPALDRDLRDTMQDRVPQTRIYRVWHAPPWGDPDLAHLELLASVLAGSKSARLDRRLIDEAELATESFAFAFDGELASLFGTVVTLKPGADAETAERELDALVDRLLEAGPAPAELDRARTRLLASFARGIERLGGFGGRSDVLAESATFGAGPDAYRTRLERLARATPEEVRDAGRRWLRAHHYTLRVEPFPALAAADATVDRSLLPPLGEPPAVRFPEVQRARLENGLEVLLLERHTAPILQAVLAVDAGAASNRRDQAGLASLALGLMAEGTAHRDAYRIADELDAIGAQLTTDTSLDLSFVRLEALRDALRPSLEIFADVALHPAFPADRLEIARRQRLATIAQEKAQPVGLAFRLAPALLYGEDHPYGLPASGFEATVAGLGQGDLAAWHRTWFRPGSATLIVTGDVTMAALRPEVERAFGGWAAGEAPAKPIAAATTQARGRVVLVDKPDAPQSVIVAAHVSLPGGQGDDLAIETAMRGFGGMSTSRLNRNLRLDKHWSYGSFAVLRGARGPRPFLVLAPVETGKTKEAMVEVASEIRGIAGERPIRGEELTSLLRNAVSRLPGRFETLDRVEEAAVDLVLYERDPAYFYDYAANVRKLDEAALDAAAAKAVQPGELVWIVIGDLAKVEAGVRELGFGEVSRLSADGIVPPP